MSMGTVNLPFDDGSELPDEEWEYPGTELTQTAATAPAQPAQATTPVVTQPGGTVTNMHPYGMFEGVPIHSITVKIKGEAQVESLAGIDVTTFDRARLVGEYTVVGVKHTVNKDGDLIREVEFKVANLELAPWDPADPTDDGILRARPKQRP